MPDLGLRDPSLGDVQLSSELLDLRCDYFKAIPEVCTERARLLTDYHRTHRLFDKGHITSLDKAHAYSAALNKRTPVVWHQHARTRDGKLFDVRDESPFAGSTTSRFKGVPLYPEFLALALWPELHTLPNRASNPYYIDRHDADVLDLDYFPFWLDKSILELARVEDWMPDERGFVPDFDLMQQMVFYLPSKPNCVSHTIPHFGRAVGDGLQAIIDDARQRARTAADTSRRQFYEAMATVMEGVVAYSTNIANFAECMALDERGADRRSKLEQIAQIYRKVPKRPASTFREGLTTVWLCWTALHLENANVGLSLGRLDQLLFPLYQADREAGRLTVDEAVELVCHLWLRIGDHVPTVPRTGEELFGGTGSNQAVTVGGVDAEGNDAVNELTYVVLRATELMRLRDPNLNARYHVEANSKDPYLRRLCEVNVATGATPAIHNDVVAIESLVSAGDAEVDARDYGIVGCVEPDSAGRHFGHSGALLVNLASALELALFNGCHRHTGMDQLISYRSGQVGSFHRFDELMHAFEGQVTWLLDSAIAMNNALGRIHQRYYPSPLLSALYRGPMDSGKDLILGGAEGNSSGIAIIGLADVVDSLAAIQRWCFDAELDRRLSWERLLGAINHDFRDEEDLWTMLINPDKTPKFGNEHERADRIAQRIVKLLHQVAKERENYRGGCYRVGYWSMTMHAGLGYLTQALPNGKRALAAFASGITPASRETPHLTPALNSVCALPAAQIGNGFALNLKFSPASPERTSRKYIAELCDTVHGYMEHGAGKRGGLEIQFNITDHEDFVKEMRDPERLPELLVRVSGYTAYFKDLNPNMQHEILRRTEYNLHTGDAVSCGPFEVARRMPEGTQRTTRRDGRC